MVRFDFMNTTKEELDIMGKIADRALTLSPELSRRPKIDLWMDLEAAHNVCPLDLEKLLAFDDFNFLHDVCGIVNTLNRATGELENCFVPRSAK